MYIRGFGRLSLWLNEGSAMITVQCRCGRSLTAQESQVNQPHKCEGCGAVCTCISAETLPDGAGSADFDAGLWVTCHPSMQLLVWRLGGCETIRVGSLPEQQIHLDGAFVSGRTASWFALISGRRAGGWKTSAARTASSSTTSVLRSTNYSMATRFKSETLSLSMRLIPNVPPGASNKEADPTKTADCRKAARCCFDMPELRSADARWVQNLRAVWDLSGYRSSAAHIAG